MKKVEFKKLNSANVLVENSADESRVYDIKGNANLNNGYLVSMDSGTVLKDEFQVASFSMYGGNVNTSYNMSISREEKCDLIYAIDDFIAEVKKEIETNPIQI